MKQSTLDNNLNMMNAFNENLDISALVDILGKKIVPIDAIYSNSVNKEWFRPAVIDTQYLCYDKYLPIYCLNDSGNPILNRPTSVFVVDYKHYINYSANIVNFNRDYTYDTDKGILYIKLKDFDESQGYPEPTNLNAPINPGCIIFINWNYGEEF